MGVEREWWRGGVVYQVYPRSFMDANGDGIGDLDGITARLDYIASLGVDAVWISPFFQSPMCDFGYDVSDYRRVDPVFGDLESFDNLLREAHRRSLKVIVDLVVSHTSNRHEWFIESSRSRTNPKSDWYLWADPKPDGTPPNNWLSHFGGPGWTWNSARRQYYYHNFLVEQPDLNYHHPEVREAVKDIFRFWLERGVDGFRLDTVNMYFQDALLRDNPPCPPERALSDFEPYDFQIHLYDKSRPENLAFLEELRALTDSYPGKVMIGEIGGDPEGVAPLLVSYNEDGKRLHMSYVFDLLIGGFSPGVIKREVERLSTLAADGWICWALSNHDVVRVVTRWGLEREARRVAPLALALICSLRGSACIYQGEELGLPEAEIPYELIQDPHGKCMWPEFKGRDGCRTPLPWSASLPNAGFSPSGPWLPVPDAHAALAVDVQEADAGSILNRCRRFLNWRKSVPALLDGEMKFVDMPGDVLAWERASGGKRILAAFNLGGGDVSVPVPFDGLSSLTGHGFGGALTNGILEIAAYDAFFGERPD